MTAPLVSSLTDGPLFVLTSDQEWAPAWAAEQFLGLVSSYEIPLHVFRTHPCEILDDTAPGLAVTHGWHPNFLPGSSHGQTREQVIQYFQTHFPQATSARSHCFAEDTFAWQLLAQAGIKADSQFISRFQANLMPLVHFTGIVRLPIYFEDDVFFSLYPGLNLKAIESTLFSPGLKVLNFHPTFVSYNVPSRESYDAKKKAIFSGRASSDLVFRGRGSRHVFVELIESILDRGHRFRFFDAVASQLRREVAAC